MGSSPRAPAPSNLGTGRPSMDAATRPSTSGGSGPVMGNPAGEGHWSIAFCIMVECVACPDCQLVDYA
jgi:hypothetical protein